MNAYDAGTAVLLALLLVGAACVCWAGVTRCKGCRGWHEDKDEQKECEERNNP